MAPVAGEQGLELRFDKSCMSSIIGPGGSTIKEVRQSSGADIHVSPGPASVSVQIMGGEDECAMARDMIVSFAGMEPEHESDCGGAAAGRAASMMPMPPSMPPRPPGTSSVVGAAHRGGGARSSMIVGGGGAGVQEGGQLTLEFPGLGVAGAIIGSRGSVVEEIKAKSGAQVRVEKDNKADQTYVHIIGEAHQIEVAQEMVQAAAESNSSRVGGGGGSASAGTGQPRPPPGPPPPWAAGGGDTEDWDDDEGGDAEDWAEDWDDDEGAPEAEETLEFEASMLSRIVGPSGSAIKGARVRSGAEITAKRIGEVCRVMLSGTHAQVKMARDLVNGLVEKPPRSKPQLQRRTSQGGGGGDATGGDEMEDHVTLTLTSQQCKRVIGSGGATLKRIKNDSGAFIKVSPSGADDTSTAYIGGSAECVDLARAMVVDILAASCKSQDVEWEDEACLQVNASEVKAIIGKSGSNIKVIENESWAKVSVDKDGPEPHLVRITGSYEAVDIGWGLVKAYMEGAGGSSGKWSGGSSGKWSSKKEDWSGGGGGGKRKWSSDTWQESGGDKWSKKASESW